MLTDAQTHMEVTLPTIHLNGTGARTLSNDYRMVCQAVNDTVTALEKAEFHQRDFYPQGSEAWQNAKAEREEAFRKLKEVKEYAMLWYVNADDRC